MAERKNARKLRSVTRTDGLVNAITGLGIAGRDKAVSNQFATWAPLTIGELEGIYRSGGVGRTIIDLPVGEMTREWFEVEGDTDNLCLGYLEERHAKMAIQDGLTWGDLYGGSIVVMGLMDGGEYDIPVNEKALLSIDYFHVYDRMQVTWTTGDLYADKAHPLFNQPEWYTVTPYSSGGSGPFRVHETRVLKFRGAKLPPRAEREQQGWGDSMLQAPYDDLRNLKAGDAHTATLIEEWAIGVLTIKNLVQLLAAKGGDQKVMDRMNVIDYGKHVLRSMVLAEGETFEKKAQAVTGLADILDRQASRLSASTRIPVTRLFGEQPRGFQATGENNREDWCDEVKLRQETKLLPELERLVRYVYISKKGPTKGVEPENWKIEFCPLDQPTAKEEADTRLVIAETDQIYLNTGVVDPNEVAISRYGGDRFSPDTTLDPGTVRERPNVPVPTIPIIKTPPNGKGDTGPASSVVTQ